MKFDYRLLWVACVVGCGGELELPDRVLCPSRIDGKQQLSGTFELETSSLFDQRFEKEPFDVFLVEATEDSVVLEACTPESSEYDWHFLGEWTRISGDFPLEVSFAADKGPLFQGRFEGGHLFRGTATIWWSVFDTIAELPAAGGGSITSYDPDRQFEGSLTVRDEETNPHHFADVTFSLTW